ncbi:MAG: DUF2892 domain-containing protein [Amylibacter sp.]|nr:DUF2892 domain-containing protein [Amylibacter sp.]
MNPNVGKPDRIIRIIVGLILAVGPYVTNLSIWSTPTMMYGSVIVGLVLIGTALFSFCPLYRIVGIRTCKM